MSIIKVVMGSFCHGDQVIRLVSERLDYGVVLERQVIKETAADSPIAEGKLSRTLSGKVSAFENFTHERERNISVIKKHLADLLRQDNLIISGAAGLLIPREISHVLCVCLIAEPGYRGEQAIKERGVTRKEAQKQIAKDDESLKLFTDYLFKKSPWDPELYDILIPMSRTSAEDAAKLIREHAGSPALKPTPASMQALMDFGLAVKVEIALGKEGHDVLVSAREGLVTLTINKNTLMLSSLEEDLKNIAGKIEGVKQVTTKVGPGFYQSDVYRRFDFEMPSRVLLVDDEKEFVQTLSERLLMREMGSAVVYDGEQALTFVREEQPEVMVLDLKMPGIDGIEVLRRIKRDYPLIEVIILTGHGTEKDEKTCMELGAFAYLNKPVDIEKLSRTMQEAYKKLRDNKPEE